MYIKNMNIFCWGEGCPIHHITWYLPVLSAKKEKQASITGNASILKKQNKILKRFTAFNLNEILFLWNITTAARLFTWTINRNSS